MLLKKPGCKVWIYRTKVNGKTWDRSTGETDRKKAMAKVPGLEDLAQRLREQRGVCSLLSSAIAKEADIAAKDVGQAEADRVTVGLDHFADFVKRDIPLEKITSQMLEDYQRHRLATAALSTYKREMNYIMRMLRRNGFNVEKPKPKRGTVTEHRPFTADEVKRFFTHCEDSFRMLFHTMLITGARPAELIPSERSRHVPLLKTEVNPEKNTIRIRNAKLKPNEKDKSRMITVPAEFMEWLVAHMETVEGEFVFPACSANLHRTFDNVLDRAKIKKVDVLGKKLTSHSFRHTYCTTIAQRLGSNPFLVMTAMGHANITTSQIYCHGESADALDLDLIKEALTERERLKQEHKQEVRDAYNERRRKWRAESRNHKKNPHSNPLAGGEWGNPVGKLAKTASVGAS